MLTILSSSIEVDLTLKPNFGEVGGGVGVGVGKGFFFPAFNFAFQARDADHLDPEENLCTAVPYIHSF